MNPASSSDFRDLPPVGELLGGPALADLIHLHGRDTVRDWVRTTIDALRAQIVDGAGAASQGRAQLSGQIVAAVRDRADHDAAARLAQVVNATGVVLHTGLGRAPLCNAARTAIVAAAGACNLEVDLASGERRYRGYQLQSAWQRLTGAEAALVVNNNAAATVLMLDALCCGREVILSRGQLVEIGGSFRLPEIFAHSGAILHEVGTTNRTRLSDYERAISPETAAILRVHPSNYRVAGFTGTPEIGELSDLARRHNLLCLDDIGSGCLVDTEQFGLPHEPTFAESLAAGADLVLGSGDKLLGGPQCGILLGNTDLITRLREHPLARAFRVDKLTLAALSATLEGYLRGTAESEIPVLTLLAASPESLFSRAQIIKDAVARDIDRTPNIERRTSNVESASFDVGRSTLDVGRLSAAARRDTPASRECALTVSVSRDTSPVGGGSLPGATLPTAILRLTHAAWSADELDRRLRLGPPRVFGRIQQDAVLLDLRSVLPEDDEQIIAALRAVATRTGSDQERGERGASAP